MRGVVPLKLTPRAVAHEFRALLDRGVELLPAGEAKDHPETLAARYPPSHVLRLFDTAFYVTGPYQDDDIGFLVAYVGSHEKRGEMARLHPRIFYKDLSLMWRVGTHLVRTASETWIGKGDLKWSKHEGKRGLYTAEETTNLPLEIQAALDLASRSRAHKRDHKAVPLILRRAPAERVAPYADFTAPRRRAQKRYPIHGGAPIAWFEKPLDPRSLSFARGFEPDFKNGVLEVARSKSKLYGGTLRKFRILSTNREVQFQFLAAPRHAWVNPPQATTTELSTYGVRTVDVEADELLFVPGYEYHFLDESSDPPEFHSQIPKGFAGPPCPSDCYRADASAWIEKLPVIREFRRRVL